MDTHTQSEIPAPPALPTSAPFRPRNRWLIGLVTAAPWVTLQLIYSSDGAGGSWGYALIYLYQLIIGILILGGMAYLAIELNLRLKLPFRVFRWPWFTLVGLGMMFQFSLIENWVRSQLLRFPEQCVVGQTIKWPTSRLSKKYLGPDLFVLVMRGEGNLARHHFTSAYLNWMGDEPAGFTGINFVQKTFSNWGEDKYVAIPATQESLAKRLGQSGLPADEVQRLADAIWKTMTAVASGQPLPEIGAKVGPRWEAVRGHLSLQLSGFIWIVALLGGFQVIAYLTIPASPALISATGTSARPTIDGAGAEETGKKNSLSHQ